MGDASEKRDRITYPESTVRRWLSGWVPPRFLDQALAELRAAAGVTEQPRPPKPTEEELQRARARLRRAGVARR